MTNFKFNQNKYDSERKVLEAHDPEYACHYRFSGSAVSARKFMLWKSGKIVDSVWIVEDEGQFRLATLDEDRVLDGYEHA